MKWRFIAVWLCLTVSQSVFCNSRIISPEVHADGSVTFRYQNKKAKRVKIVSDCLRKRHDHSAFGEKTRRERMQRDTNGIWTFTTKQLPSEVYFYYFVVDGKRIYDPLNEDSTFILLHQVSQFTVASKE
ncbi:MAG: hypothetical protein II502_04585, partial [Paludibacteraceae bacterium]|nr:hypothetical protein [Paludibacteraceae bacterium]